MTTAASGTKASIGWANISGNCKRRRKTVTASNSGKEATGLAKSEYNIKQGTQEIISTRTFDAPRELVFKAMTDPDLVPKWWGPRNLSTRVDKMDVKPGGTWRFIQRDSAGNEFGFHGVYHLVEPPARVVQT